MGEQMRRLSAVVFTVALAAAACGGSDGGTTTTGGSGTSATTTGGTTATTQAPATTEALSGGRALIAQAVGFEGVYEGEWNNTTFGSTGPIKITVTEVNTESGFILIAVDLGGNVFGQEDPDPFTLEIYTSGDGLDAGFTTFFKESTIEVGEDGTITLNATPAAVGEIVIEGALVDGPDGQPGFEGTYSIPGLAEGTWNAYKTG